MAILLERQHICS